MKTLLHILLTFVFMLLICLPAKLVISGAPETLATNDAASTQYYGADGFNVINDTEQYPAYAIVSTRGVDRVTVWAASTTDERALQKATSTTDRTAAAWSTMQTSFDVDIQITDGQTHQVALYFVDWDSQNRAQRLAVITNDTLVDYRLIESFSGGVYVLYNISGRVLFRVWRESASDAVLSGIFFQPVGVPPSPTPTPTPTATPTPQPSPSPSPTPTATPTPTPGTCSPLPNGKCKKGCICAR